ncbi:helix-turn-helix transcriptional regulator [Intrasporangium sp. YIM S08009]|uniref:helix-turn-helix transcriptional regulator n=1 Tax=Intrasporangium zincisolvens TaxID=3080018 RepID=UPI002B056F27|nr:helix-turn-helix domain-containing protein [Intrasporangium sp. YIM S08009]
MERRPAREGSLPAARRTALDLLRQQAVAGGRRSPAMTASEVADALGVHVTTARFHLELLVENGLVASTYVRAGVGRPRKVYVATPVDALVSREAFRAFAQLLSRSWSSAGPGADGTSEEAGERWVAGRTAGDALPPPAATTPGAWLGKVGLAVDLLDEWGYEPEVRTTDRGRTVELTLHDCPFLAMARQHPDVVCGIHRGLVRGTLAAVGEADADVELRPFVTERSCVARLTSAAVPGRVGP